MFSQSLKKGEKTMKHNKVIRYLSTLGICLVLVTGCSQGNKPPAPDTAQESTSAASATQEDAGEEASVEAAQENEEASEDASQETAKAPEAELYSADEGDYTVKVLRFDIGEDILEGGYEFKALAEIENKGSTNMYFDEEAFIIEDADGNEILSDTSLYCGPSVIRAGEKGYVYNQYPTALEGVTDTSGLRLRPQFTVVTPDKEQDDYEVSDLVISEGFLGISFEGEITNHKDEDNNYFYIYIILYDKNGDVLGVTGAVADMPAGETVSFQSYGADLPEDITIDMIADYKVIARDAYFNW